MDKKIIVGLNHQSSNVEERIKNMEQTEEHIIPEDESTTILSRTCSGCERHQSIAGALLRSKEWRAWYKYASENMLYDVDETLTIDVMSDNHWNDFIRFIRKLPSVRVGSNK